jgi:methylamine utilization protein MauE
VLGVSLRPDVVRVAAAVELFLGTLALSVSGAIIAALVALSYAVFLVIVVLALVRRAPIDSCGCLGRLDTPPSWRHVVVLGLALLGAVGAMSDPDPSLLERITGDGAGGVALLVLVVVGILIAIGVLRMGRQPSQPTSGS